VGRALSGKWSLRVRIGAISRKKSYKNIEKSHITLLLSFYQNTVFSPQISLELLLVHSTILLQTPLSLPEEIRDESIWN
jgi:hypothetical protein